MKYTGIDMLQETTYNEHTYKLGDFVYFIEEETDHTFCYFGKIKYIKPFKLFEEDNNQCIIEVLYTEYGFKFPEPFEKLTISSYLRPAKESLDRLINDKQNEIKALTELYEVI